MTDPGLFLPASDDKDYQKLFEKYQEKFNKAYLRSISLWKEEKTQRRALYSYKRQVNALLDLLVEYESEPELKERSTPYETLIESDKPRISNLIESNPRLSPILDKLLNLDDEQLQLSSNYNLNLYLNEMIPDIAADELDHVQINPQEPESWVRRHYPGLVVSKFKPLVISPSMVLDPGVSTNRSTVATHVRKKRIRAEEDDFTKILKPPAAAKKLKLVKLTLKPRIAPKEPKTPNIKIYQPKVDSKPNPQPEVKMEEEEKKPVEPTEKAGDATPDTTNEPANE